MPYIHIRNESALAWTNELRTFWFYDALLFENCWSVEKLWYLTMHGKSLAGNFTSRRVSCNSCLVYYREPSTTMLFRSSSMFANWTNDLELGRNNTMVYDITSYQIVVPVFKSSQLLFFSTTENRRTIWCFTFFILPNIWQSNSTHIYLFLSH